MAHKICDYPSIEIRNCTIVHANAKQVTIFYKAPSILASFSAVFHSFKVLSTDSHYRNCSNKRLLRAVEKPTAPTEHKKMVRKVYFSINYYHLKDIILRIFAPAGQPMC